MQAPPTRLVKREYTLLLPNSTDIHTPRWRRLHRMASQQHPPATSNGPPKMAGSCTQPPRVGMLPATSAVVLQHSLHPTILPSPPRHPTPDQAGCFSTSNSACRSPATSQGAWMWYHGAPQPSWMLTTGVVSSAHPPPAPLMPPDQRISLQTSTRAVFRQLEQLTMVLQCA